MIFKDSAISAWTGFTTTDTGASATGTKSIVEGSTGTLLTLSPTGTTATSTWAFGTNGNPGDIASSTIAAGTSGVITLAAGKTLDYESTKTYVLIVM